MSSFNFQLRMMSGFKIQKRIVGLRDLPLIDRYCLHSNFESDSCCNITNTYCGGIGQKSGDEYFVNTTNAKIVGGVGYLFLFDIIKATYPPIDPDEPFVSPPPIDPNTEDFRDIEIECWDKIYNSGYRLLTSNLGSFGLIDGRLKYYRFQIFRRYWTGNEPVYINTNLKVLSWVGGSTYPESVASYSGEIRTFIPKSTSINEINLSSDLSHFEESPFLHQIPSYDPEDGLVLNITHFMQETGNSGYYWFYDNVNSVLPDNDSLCSSDDTGNLENHQDQFYYSSSDDLPHEYILAQKLTASGFPPPSGDGIALVNAAVRFKA